MEQQTTHQLQNWSGNYNYLAKKVVIPEILTTCVTSSQTVLMLAYLAHATPLMLLLIQMTP